MVSGAATFCNSCGGDRFIEAAIRKVSLAWPQRLAILSCLGLIAWLGLPPLLKATGAMLLWLWQSFLGLAVCGFALWVLTGLLPPPAGRWVRGAAWSVFKLAGRGIRNLFG